MAAPTITVDGNAATLGTPTGVGTASWTYPITNGNPSGNPVLAGSTVLLSAAAGVWVSTAGGVPNAAVSGASVTNASGIYNQGVFVTASNRYLSVASAAGVQPTDNFWVSAWVNLAAKTTSQMFVTKWSNTSNLRQWMLRYDQPSDRFGFVVASDGVGTVTTAATASTFGSPTAGVWYHLFGWLDTVSGVVGISVGGTANTAAHVAGVFKTGTAGFQIGNRQNSSLPFGGNESAVVWGRDPVGGFAAYPAATIMAGLRSGSSPVRPSLISGANRTAWGAISGYLDTTILGDVIGSNTLTNNNAVTLATGVIP